MKNLKVALFFPVLALAFFIGTPYASAAPALSCGIDEYADTSVVTCEGSDYDPGFWVGIYVGTSDACDSEGQIGTCLADGNGDFTGCVKPVEPPYPAGTRYVYSSSTGCAVHPQTIADSNNPHILLGPPVPFYEYIGTGLLGIVGDMGDYFGPIALIVVGFALGLFGIKVGYSYLISYVAVRKERRTRRRRRT